MPSHASTQTAALSPSSSSSRSSATSESPPLPASPPPLTSTAVRDDLRCKYPYKACFHPRSIKKDGEMHSLCEFHRKKANSIQKIYATKRRQQLRALKKHKILQHKQRETDDLPDRVESFATRLEHELDASQQYEYERRPPQIKPDSRRDAPTTRQFDMSFLLNHS
ncbi:unnamed protein product [Aphanomyces euteiches]